MKKSLYKVFLGVSLFGIVLTGCSNGQVDPHAGDEKYEIYELYRSSGGDMSYEEWLNSIKGEDGLSLLTGADTPIVSIGKEGDTYINTSTWDFYKKENGVWIKKGNIIGSQGEQGPAGPQGPQGNPGQNGKDGQTPYIGDNGHWWIGTTDTGYPAIGQDGTPGENGKDGVSISSIEKTSSSGNVDTYTITFSNNTTFEYTVTNGVDGSQGPQGPQGEQGKDGSSVLTGNGVPYSALGEDKDSYINLDNWDYYVKENGEWVIKGNIKGGDGKSAYDIYIEAHPDYCKSENEWLDDLINGELGNKQIHTVTFNSNGGTNVDTQFVLHGEKATKPLSPTKDYFVFSDWVDENNDHWVFNGFSITSDIVLNAVWVQEYDYSSIVINEVCSKSRKSFIDQYNEESDWIELYNNQSGDINLKGCGLSKSKDDLYQLIFDDIIIQGESYMVIAASGRSNKLYKNEYHAPFTLSNKKSGSLFFSSPFKIENFIEYPALKDDISYGVLGDELTMLIPSAGKNNEKVYVEKQILPAPTFSKPSGVYKNEFNLTLSSEYGYKIFYTVDSATPTKESLEFDSPIRIYDKSSEPNILSSRRDICGSKSASVPTSPVAKCMVVRAICYDENGNYSPVVSSSYWIDQDEYLLKNISIMSINTDFDNLFDYENGIYCTGKTWDDWKNSDEYDSSLSAYDQPGNYYNKGFDWERQANLTFLNEKHNVKCEQNVGIRIKGNTSRGREKKSFNVYSRFLYDGSNKLDYKFNGRKCESITLAAYAGSQLIFRDPLNSSVAQRCNLNFTTQNTTPTHLYLNGEFWGIYYIADKYDSKYIEETYDVEDAMLFKAGEVEEGYQSDISFFNNAVGTINKTLLTEDGYKLFENSFDTSSLADYILYQAYIDTKDFSLFGQNSAYWMSKYCDDNPYSDTLLRPMLYDVEMTTGIGHNVDDFPYLFDKISSSSRYRYLFQNEKFSRILLERGKKLCDLLSSKEQIEFVHNYVEDSVKLTIMDNYRQYRVEGLLDSQRTQIDKMYNFYDNRSTYFSEFLNQLFDNRLIENLS